MRLHKALISLTLGIAVAICSVAANSFMPILHNFSKIEYGGALQNWDISQGPNGEIYVGNSTGLLRYDGYNWSHTPLPRGGVVRSVLCDADRVYVGSYRDFGYFTSDRFGVFRYTPLYPDNIPEQEEEIWNIVKDKKGIIYFQSFYSWFVYDGKTVTRHFDDGKRPLYLFEIDGEIYTQILNGDFYRVDGDKLTLLFTRDRVGDSHIVAALGAGAGKIVLCSQWSGLYTYDKGQVSRMVTEVDDKLKASNVNRATILRHDSVLAVGTILDGVYGIGADGKLRWHYNMNNRLANNSILDLKSDDNGDLWVALDSGIAMIGTGSPFSLLSPDNSSPTIGMVYGVCSHDNKLYIATNQAAWAFDRENGRFNIIPGCDGQNWFVNSYNHQVIVGNNEGSRIVSGLFSAPLGKANQSSTCMQVCDIARQRVLLESSYGSLQVYTDDNGTWKFAHSIDGFYAPVAQFEVDHLGNIWATHMSHGLFRVRPTDDLRHCTYKRFEHLGGDSVFDRFHLVKLRDRIIFSFHNKLYTYDDLNDTIVRFTDLKSIENMDIYSATEVDKNTNWISTATNFMMVRWDGDKYTVVHTVTPAQFGLDGNDEINMVNVKDNMAYFCLNNGIGCLDMSRHDARVPARRQLRLLSVITTDKHGNTTRLPIDDTGSIESNATITLSYPNYRFEALTFHYHLQGGGITLDNDSPEPVITYNSLGYGDYQLTATVTNVDGEQLSTVQYTLSHPRPWHLTWWAWIIYLIILLAIIYLVVRYRTQKTARDLQRQYQADKLQQDLKMLEQDKIIAQQKQQLLEAQLNDKIKEVSSMALDAVARSQAIQSVKTSIREKQRNGSISDADIKAMLLQLGDNADSDNFWESYQNNFNLVHAGFFRNLKERYPALTSSDLRFCALLRLNLSTKDIARFTQLSVRGVEGARYRLRKKFDLPADTPLIDFLISFHP